MPIAKKNTRRRLNKSEPAASLRMAELCRELGVTYFTLRRWLIAGTFPPGVRFTPLAHPRWWRKDIDAWKASRPKASAA